MSMSGKPPYRTFGAIVRAAGFLVSGVKRLTAATTATVVKNAGRTNTLKAAAGFTVTLPASTGGGAVYRFVAETAASSGDYVVKVANATDVFAGGVLINDIGDSTAATADFWPTASTSDTFTMAYATGGGKVGDWVEFEDIKAGTFAVRGSMQGMTDPATPFSATVS
jgi:hypothetical protein